MSDNDTQKAYFLCNFPRKGIRVLEYLMTYIELEMHIDQYFLCRSNWLASSFGSKLRYILSVLNGIIFYYLCIYGSIHTVPHTPAQPLGVCKVGACNFIIN